MIFNQVNQNAGGVNNVFNRETTDPLPRLVAFAGYAGAGKDEAAKALMGIGYVRHNFGDIIKGQLDPLIRRHFGFSAFTEDREQKTRIRRTLESWGEDNYDSILREFLVLLPRYAVNTRLVRVREARAWKDRGGVILRVERPGVEPATPWEAERMAELVESGLIDDAVVNGGTAADLRENVLTVLRIEGVARRTDSC